MEQSLFEHVLLPVASEDDAHATARAVLPHMAPTDGLVTVINVIEKARGAPDKASVEQREMYADKVFAVIIREFGQEEIPVNTHIEYHTNVAEAISTAADDINASSIVFTPRGGSQWLKILTGDITHSLINQSNRPVIVLPDMETD